MNVSTNQNPNEQRAIRPLRFGHAVIVISPAIVGLLVANIIEWGLLFVPLDHEPSHEIELPLVWLIQSMVAGNLTVLCYSIWLHSCLRARRCENETLRLKIILSTAWVQVGWILYFVARLDSLLADDAALPVILVALPVFAIVIPLLWNAVLRLDHPRQFAWILGGFLLPAVMLQVASVARLAAEPELIFTVESALIALAIAIWLAVFAATSSRTFSLQTV